MVKKGETTGARRALYRKYRPRSLDEIVSQSHATDILRRSLSQGRVSHAYLLTGPKGVGKTSIARILAHEINQLPYSSDEPHLDIIEIDAASNNGVDDVRELRDRVMLAPISASKKIYIIDEVHMLSKQAFNALLKTLEEPPAHVVFILATTDLHKVPDTIISRTQHFSFHAISRADLAEHLRKIADGEGIKVSDDALDLIASRGDGSFRNAISLLDQLSGYTDGADGITRELVESTLGFAPADSVDVLLDAVNNGDSSIIITTLEALERHGIQPIILADQLVESLRMRLLEQPKLAGLMDSLLDIATSSRPQLKLLTTLLLAGKPSTDSRPVTMATVATKAPAKPKPTVIEAPVIIVDKADAVEAMKPAKKKSKPAEGPFEWSAFMDYIKDRQVALHSVLANCGHDVQDGKLVIYCVRKFNKTKLDEARYQAVMSDALEQLGHGELTIDTVPTTKPPADEKLARIAEIMGGGQEVELNEEKKS